MLKLIIYIIFSFISFFMLGVYSESNNVSWKQWVITSFFALFFSFSSIYLYKKRIKGE